jgi:hypothetical protein
LGSVLSGYADATHSAEEAPPIPSADQIEKAKRKRAIEVTITDVLPCIIIPCSAKALVHEHASA